MRMVKVLLVCLLLFLALTAAYQNITPIQGKTITLGLNLTDYVGKWQTKPIPLGFVIVACFMAGAILMILVNIPVWFGYRRRLRDLQRELGVRPAAGGGSASGPPELSPAEEGEE